MQRGIPVAADPGRNRTDESLVTALLVIGGFLLVAVATVDALWTTLWVEAHAGPLAARLAAVANRLGVRVLARFGHRAMSVKGPLILVQSIAVWVALTWAGWVMVFASTEGALVDPHTGAPAAFAERIYFTGYSLWTMGNGDFSPRGAFYQVATGVAALNGMILVTLVVTFLVSVIAAVADKRSFSSQVTALGRSPADFVISAWDRGGFPMVELHLSTLAANLSSITEKNLAYPMLHYFHAVHDPEAVATGAAILDDAVAILMHGVAEAQRPARAPLRVADNVLHGYLTTLRDAHVSRSEHVPPLPSLDPLRDAGIPTVTDEEFAAAMQARRERRQVLLGSVQAERRPWPGG